MYEPGHTLSDKFRWLILGLPLLLISFLIFSLQLPPSEAHAQDASSTAPEYTMSTYDSPNALTNGMARTADNFAKALASTEHALSNSGQSITTALSQGGRSMAQGASGAASAIGNGVRNGATHTARGIGSGVTFMARAVGSGVVFIVKTPLSILGLAADTPMVRAVIQPAGSTQVPIIDPASPIAITTYPALPAAATADPKPDYVGSSVVWPLYGEITTFFGVPHWPYQPTHTGLDISDGKPSGATPIKPFKPGRVIGTVQSGSGLGNHITVDHGEGMTSVYAHLSSISVQVGQPVDNNTTLGFEGSTGASTGTHLHFEIRLNGQPVDPRRFINGQPS